MEQEQERNRGGRPRQGVQRTVILPAELWAAIARVQQEHEGWSRNDAARFIVQRGCQAEGVLAHTSSDRQRQNED